MAEEQGLELVEVNPRAAPPVCRIMDFGKFKYETSKKEKASRKHQSTVVVKEIKFRPKTDDPRPRFQGEAHPPLPRGGEQVSPGHRLPRPGDRSPGDRSGDARRGPSRRWATPPWWSRRPRWKAGAWCSPWDPDRRDWSVLLVRRSGSWSRRPGLVAPAVVRVVRRPRLVRAGPAGPAGRPGRSGWSRLVRCQPGRRWLRSPVRVRSPGGSRGPKVGHVAKTKGRHFDPPGRCMTPLA